MKNTNSILPTFGPFAERLYPNQKGKKKKEKTLNLEAPFAGRSRFPVRTFALAVGRFFCLLRFAFLFLSFVSFFFPFRPDH